MAYTEKFQTLADAAMTRVEGVAPNRVNDMLAQGTFQGTFERNAYQAAAHRLRRIPA